MLIVFLTLIFSYPLLLPQELTSFNGSYKLTGLKNLWTGGTVVRIELLTFLSLKWFFGNVKSECVFMTSSLPMFSNKMSVECFHLLHTWLISLSAYVLYPFQCFWKGRWFLKSSAWLLKILHITGSVIFYFILKPSSSQWNPFVAAALYR